MTQPHKRRARGRHLTLDNILAVLSLLGVIASMALTVLLRGGVRDETAVGVWIIGGVLWVLLAIGWAWGWQRGRSVGDGIDLTVLAFLGYLGLWYLWAPVEWEARKEGLWVTTYAAVFWSMRYLLTDRRWMIWTVTAMVALGVITFAYAVVHHGQHQYPIWGDMGMRPDYGMRWSGTFGCPNHFANYMAMAAMGGLLLLAYQRISWPLRLIALYFVICFSAAIFFSQSRGGLAAWLAGLAVMAFAWFRISTIRWPWKVGVVLVVAILCVIALGTSADMRQRLFEQDHTANPRVILAKDAINIWSRSPVFGTGPATFDYEHQRMRAPSYTSRATYTHNDYLNTLSDYGVVGLALVLIFLVLSARELLKRRHEDGTERERLLALLGLSVLTLMAVHSVVDFSLHIPGCALTFFAILGLCLQVPHRDQLAGNPIQRVWMVLLVSCAVLSLSMGGWLIVQTHRGLSLVRELEQIRGPLSLEDLRILIRRAQDSDARSWWVAQRAGDLARTRMFAWRREVIEPLIERASDIQTDPVTVLQALQPLVRERNALGYLALESYQRASRLNPLNDALLVKQGIVLDQMDQFTEAFILYQRALEKQPYSIYFHHALAYHFLHAGSYELFLGNLQSAMGFRDSSDQRAADFWREAITHYEAVLLNWGTEVKEALDHVTLFGRGAPGWDGGRDVLHDAAKLQRELQTRIEQVNARLKLLRQAHSQILRRIEVQVSE